MLFAITSILLCYYLNASIKAGGIFAVLFLFSGSISLREKRIKIGSGVLWFIGWIFFGYCTLFLSQLLQNESVFRLPYLQVFLGLICCLVPALIFYFITLKPAISSVMGSALLLLLSTANYYVYSFRGSELCPADLLTIGTALNVVDKYSFSLPGNILYAWILFGIIGFLATGLPSLDSNNKSKSRVATLFVTLTLCVVFFGISPQITVQHFLHGGSYWNGYLLNFTLQIKEAIVHKPDTYSKDNVQRIAQNYMYDSVTNDERHPDIIVIMDEAYSDLGIIGDGLQTNVSVSPFISSLRENTTYGYTLSSVYGGGTPNSEYEFLTGNSLLFVNGIVYQQYLRQPSYSLVSVLKNCGYHCIAMHPYLENGWRRNVVWPNLLFDECLFLNDFPQQELVRGLVSDQEMFEVMLETYHSREINADEPLFLFGVTMQNHSAYDYSGEDFTTTVRLEGYDTQYPEIEQYLSLIHETDRAVEYLLTELEESDRDIVVVFYGDHQPAVSNHFLQEIHGGALETLDEQQLLQMVPFFIWTNYESESKKVELTSLNYLSNYLFEKAGLALPAYNLFLQDEEQIVPAMNSYGYYSSSKGEFQTYAAAEGQEKEWLDQYWLLEYNSLFDVDNLNLHMFPLAQ